jgi:hypothetical protein
MAMIIRSSGEGEDAYDKARESVVEKSEKIIDKIRDTIRK